MPLSTEMQNQAQQAASAGQILVALTVHNPGAAGREIPITTGVCFPRGCVRSDTQLALRNPAGKNVALQSHVNACWPDGSSKWVLIDFVAETLASGQSTWQLCDGGASRTEASVDTQVQLDGRAVVLKRTDASPLTLDLPFVQDGTTFHPQLDGITQTVAGAVRSEFIAKGRLQEARLNIQLRLETWAKSDRIRVHVRIHNPSAAKHAGGLWDLGDPGSVLFDSFGVDVRAVGMSASKLSWKAERDHVWQTSDVAELSIYQDSSGRENWQSTNHWNREQHNPCRFRGYQTETPAGQSTGNHAEPIARLSAGSETLEVSVPEFWQQFPKSLIAKDDSVHVGLFPAEWDDQFELQGGEQKAHSFWLRIGSVDAEQGGSECGSPSDCRVTMLPEWFNACQVLPWFRAEQTESYARIDRYLDEALSGDRSWELRRDAIDEYGWRNFGEVHADHEQGHFSGDQTVVSHYNNQFDMIFGAILQFARSGDPAWYDMFDPLARHMIDIDIYHTSEDRDAYSGGLFWHTDHYVDARTASHRTYSALNANGNNAYGGGMCNEHNYTTGLLHYYYLTGNPDVRDAVIELADWVVRMDDGRSTIFGLVDDEPTGLASATVFPDFHGPGRGSGNSVNTMLDAFLLSGERSYLAKADELIRRVVHPNQDLEPLHLDDSEGHWSYTVFLMGLGRYLEAKAELDELDEIYAYGRATLQRYGRWMAEHEKTALSRPDEVQYVTEAWPTQDIRKANVLRIAARFEDDADWRDRMRAKAEAISDEAWQQMYEFDARYVARTISVLMTEGLREGWHREHNEEVLPQARWSGDFGQHTEFFSQRDRVKRGLKRPGTALRMALRAMHPKRWVRFARAIRKRM